MAPRRRTLAEIECQLIEADRMAGDGLSTEEICWSLRISRSTLYRWEVRVGLRAPVSRKHPTGMNRPVMDLFHLIPHTDWTAET